MTVERFRPFRELSRMQEALDRMWGDAWPFQTNGDSERRWGIAVDILDNEKEVEVKASLPDIDPDKIDVTVDGGMLTIKGETSSEKEEKKGDYLLKERRSGSFYRSVRLPESADVDKVQSKYEKGVLTLTFPKKATSKVKKIKVTPE